MYHYYFLAGPLTSTGPVRLARDDAYGAPLSNTLKGTIQPSYKPPRPPVKYVQPAPAYEPETVYYKDTYNPPAPSYSAPAPSYEAEETNNYRDESTGPGVFDNLVPLMNLLYPSTIVGGIGLLTMAFYVKQVDDAYNRTLSKFNKLHNNTDLR